MNRWHWLAPGAGLVVLAVTSGCGVDAPASGDGGAHAARAATMTTVMTTTTATVGTATAATVATAVTSVTAERRATIRSSGGAVEVRGVGSTLELVSVTPAPGFTADVTRPSATQVTVHFEQAGTRVDIVVELTADGIHSSTHAVSTGS